MAIVGPQDILEEVLMQLHREVVLLMQNQILVLQNGILITTTLHKH
jgi:hypothetical protein